MNKTIYVRDEGQWDKIKLIAEQGGVSVSELILSQFEGSGVRLGKETQMDRIESKLDRVLNLFSPPIPSFSVEPEVVARRLAKEINVRKPTQEEKDSIIPKKGKPLVDVFNDEPTYVTPELAEKINSAEPGEAIPVERDGERWKPSAHEGIPEEEIPAEAKAPLDDDIKMLAKKQAQLDAMKKNRDIKGDLRAEYRKKFPNQMCPQCHEKNRDCEC